VLGKMRFLKILIIIIGIYPNNIYSQIFGGGIIAGVSTTQVAGDLLGGFNKIGFLAGGYTSLKIKDKINIRFEIKYIEKGSKNPRIKENNFAEISLSYIEIPISINLKQKENIGVEFGLYPAFLIDSEMNDFFSKINIDPAFIKYDFGIFAGINYKITEKMILNTQISNSIIPIRPHVSGVKNGINKGQYNTTLNFALHYKIR
tara:strand:+ start:3023 stop:3631 length:609 start_codon:yes stop_codon:yes gene_type:complete